MTDPQVTPMLVPGIALVGLWILFFWLNRDYRVDAFRQHIFGLRDELFDYARSGHISFEDPAYKLLRARLNGLLRFGHQLTLAWLASATVIRALRPAPLMEEQVEKEFENALSAVHKPTQDKLRKLHARAGLLAAEHIILSSPVFWLLVIPVLFVAIIHSLWEGGSYLLQKFPWAGLIDREAAARGALA